MNKIFWCLIVLIWLLGLVILFSPLTGISYVSYVRAEELTTKEQAQYFADLYKIDSVKFLKVINCESRFKPNAINYHDGGKGKHSVGVLQFQESTFNSWEKILGEDLNYTSAYDQLKLGAFMWSKGQMNQWSCYRIIKK